MDTPEHNREPVPRVWIDGDPPPFDVCRIALTCGQWAVVDPEDLCWLSQWDWRYQPPVRPGATGYGVRTERVGDRNRRIMLHRAVLGLTSGDGVVTDHINRDGLDNRRTNLRMTDAHGNARNQRERPGISGITGVRQRPGGRWEAGVRSEQRRVHLGVFDTAEEAVGAYRRAAIARNVGAPLPAAPVLSGHKRPPQGRSGRRGVEGRRYRGRPVWRASITVEWRMYYLGDYATVDAAFAVRLQAEEALVSGGVVGLQAFVQDLRLRRKRAPVTWT